MTEKTDNIIEFFEPYHIRRKEILETFPIPDFSTDDYSEKMKKRTEKLNALYDEIGNEKGANYEYLFSRYERMKENKNIYIDIAILNSPKVVSSLVEAMRKCGIEKFVVTNKHPNLIEGIWYYLQNGCVIEGMVEINKAHFDIEYTHTHTEKLHGFLLRIN